MPTELDSNQTYSAKWDALEYERNQYLEPNDGLLYMNRRILMNLYHLFEFIPSGQSFIDIGCGPCPIWSIPASKKFTQMHFADFMQENLDRCRQWLDGTLANQAPVPTQKICAEIEYSGWNEIQRRLMQATQGFHKCDVMSKPIIHDLNGDLFDCAMCLWVLECPAQTFEDYTKAVANIGALLKPGGYLVVADELNAGGYAVGDTVFKQINFERPSQMDKCVADAGFKIIETIVHKYEPIEMEGQYYVSDAHNIVLAKKL